MTLEYRQYIPEDKKSDADFYNQVCRQVRGNLSMMTSESDDPNEFFGEVAIDTRSSRKGGFWVHGAIERPLNAAYADADVPESEYAFLHAERAIEHEPVDFSPEEYAAHLERKHGGVSRDDNAGDAESDVPADLRLKGGDE